MKYINHDYLIQFLKTMPGVEDVAPIRRCKLEFGENGKVFCVNCRQGFKAEYSMGGSRVQYCPYCGGLNEGEEG